MELNADKLERFESLAMYRDRSMADFFRLGLFRKDARALGAPLAAAWEETARFALRGLMLPFFFAADVSCLLSGLPLPPPDGEDIHYAGFLRLVQGLVARWAEKGEFTGRGGRLLDRRPVLGPLLRELLCCLDTRGLAAVSVPGKEWDAEAFRLPDPFPGEPEEGSPETAGDDFALFRGHRLREVLDRAPELLDRSLCGPRLKRQQEARGAGGPRPAAYGQDALLEKSAEMAVCDLKLVREYRNGATQPSPAALASMAGAARRALVGGEALRRMEPRVLSHGPPPGHPNALLLPKPVLMNLMAESKVPAYKDLESDREPFPAVALFALHLSSARRSGGAGESAAGVRRLKLAALLAAHDILCHALYMNIGLIEAAFLFQRGEGASPENGSLARRQGPVLVRAGRIAEARRLRDRRLPLFLSLHETFPALFLHAPPWLHGDGGAAPDAAGSAGALLDASARFLSGRRGWRRKALFLMGGGDFPDLFREAGARGGGRRLAESGADIYAVRLPKPGEAFGLAYGRAAGTGFSTCDHPFSRFRLWAVERLLSAGR